MEGRIEEDKKEKAKAKATSTKERGPVRRTEEES
jgi:hypothetical protein